MNQISCLSPYIFAPQMWKAIEIKCHQLQDCCQIAGLVKYCQRRSIRSTILNKVSLIDFDLVSLNNTKYKDLRTSNVFQRIKHKGPIRLQSVYGL